MSQILLLSLSISSIVVKSSQCTDSNSNACDYCLSQINFKYGTYRIRSPGLYCLRESIQFNPIPGDTDTPNTVSSWFPTDNDTYPGCTLLDNGPFALGFFTVISIEASNVKIDLNGYKISYHLHFYLQQRFGSIIEIANQPFLPSVGSANFGDNFIQVSNITITNGELGLCSHHGIHSNNASNIIISHIHIYDFEVAGIHLNGFQNAVISSVDIGPSLQFVPLTAYYSNARFLSIAMGQLLNGIKAADMTMPTVSFAYLEDGDSLTLQEIYDNLIEAMDIIFRIHTDGISEHEKKTDGYKQAMKLFKNYDHLPDGSAIYGIILNSFSVAGNSFGDANNDGPRQGENIYIEDVIVHDLELKTREVIGVNFEVCQHDSWEEEFIDPIDTEPSSNAEAVVDQHMLQVDDLELILTGPFGDVMDIAQMIPTEQVHKILAHDDDIDLNKLQYIGNPLADAQIALYLHGEYLKDGRDYAYSSFISQYFLEWSVRGMVFPQCASLVADRDIMHHPTKGVIGIRMDGIEEVEMKNISIDTLANRTPLSSCIDCEREDDVIYGSLEWETNVRGMSMFDTDLIIFGRYNKIHDMDSWHGSSKGFDIMDTESSYILGYKAVLAIDTLLSHSHDGDDIHAQYNPFIILGITGLILCVILICIGTYCCHKDRPDIRNELSFSIHRDSIMAYTPRSSTIALSPSGVRHDPEFTF